MTPIFTQLEMIEPSAEASTDPGRQALFRQRLLANFATEQMLDGFAREIRQELAAARQAGVSMLTLSERRGRSGEGQGGDPHGYWLKWLYVNFRLSERSSARYMRIHAQWAKVEPISHAVAGEIPLRELDKLLADPTRRRRTVRAAEEEPLLPGADRYVFIANGLRMMTAEVNRLSDDEVAACLAQMKDLIAAAVAKLQNTDFSTARALLKQTFINMIRGGLKTKQVGTSGTTAPFPHASAKLAIWDEDQHQ